MPQAPVRVKKAVSKVLLLSAGNARRIAAAGLLKQPQGRSAAPITIVPRSSAKGAWHGGRACSGRS
ncbi:hypothetical protein GDI2481 [Gluconacetobacter diazotrophicus PA1 5]|uniref:Uncharacterized protein n=1 Tax=Gluconacetobacter diazotrophicus (strain ATCC 49037 / DSM 5601 / CCUG 37298 / CIP 103539 / LMG 7603 / PAl5) TaxID=272568 RepID=A9HNC3_GLUDA|nr:hypothetical protein GDI2481 [Gluconacetobacter diazotrophicus PA1 5]